MSTRTPQSSYPPFPAARYDRLPNLVYNTNRDTTTVAGRIWVVFKIVYLEVMQILTSIILSAVAYWGFHLNWLDSCPPVLASILVINLAYLEHMSRSLGFTTPPTSRDSWTIKVTGYRLLCTVVPLGMAIAKGVLSFVNQAVAANVLDLVIAIVVGVVLMWIGYYGDAYETVAPWFFHDDYSRFVFKALVGLGNLGVSTALALLFLYPIDTSRPGLLVLTVSIFEIGSWYTRFSELPNTHIFTMRFFNRLTSAYYIGGVLQTSLTIWHQSDTKHLHTLKRYNGGSGLQSS